MKLLLFATILLLALDRAHAQPLTLTRDGKPTATVVLAKQPTRAAEFAAWELREHVRRITGAMLPLADDATQTKSTRILVGESEATRKLGLRSADFASQEHLIKFLPDTLVLMGRDEPAQEAAQGEHDPEWVDGRFGKALQFDGKGKVVVVPDCGFDDEVGTMEAWVWTPKEITPHHGTIFRLDGANPWTYHIVQRPPDSRRIQYVTYDGENGRTVQSGELAEGWHNVMATHSRATGNIELFIDGKSVGTAECLRTTCKGATLSIGGCKPQPTVSNGFNGLIDEVRVSDVVREPVDEAGPYEPDEHTTLLFHFDEGKGAPRDSSGRPTIPDPPGFFDERGTLNAVYDFLERYCDVRWYAPTEVGTCHPTTKDLTVQGADIRRTPTMKYRWPTARRLLMPTKDDPLPAVDETLWKLRMRLGGAKFAANHSFYGYYDRFLEDHPDWFAKGYEGKPPQMCFTNEGFLAQVVQDARDYFDGKGAHTGAQAQGDYFGLVPMDNGNWCKCDTCQAQMDPAEADNQQFTNGKASNYIWGFVNKVAKEVRKTHPDKWVSALAYADYAQYPKQVKLEPNVACMMCLTARHWWAPGMEAADRKMFDAWTKNEGTKRPLYLWLYYCFPALNAKTGNYNAFPGFFAHTVAKQMKQWTDAGIEGMFLEHSSEMGQSYLLDQLEFYVTFRLGDDPTLDGNALIDEFFTRYYGAAAEPMKRLYCGIEDTWSDPNSYPEHVRELPGKTEHQNEEQAWKWLGTDERMAAFGKLMTAARDAARTDLEKQRVALFEKGIWDYMVEGKREYASRAQGRERADQ